MPRSVQLGCSFTVYVDGKALEEYQHEDDAYVESVLHAKTTYKLVSVISQTVINLNRSLLPCLKGGKLFCCANVDPGNQGLR